MNATAETPRCATTEAQRQEDHRPRQHRLWHPRDLIAVTLVATIARLILLWGTHPALYWDSKGYLRIARYLLAHGHPPLLTMRLPGYPLFMVLSGGLRLNLSATVFFQHLLGVGTVLFLFLTILTVTRSRAAAIIGAFVLTAMPDIILMEVVLYSETLATFLVALASYLFVSALVSTSRPSRLALLGAVVAYGAWTRPILAVMIPMMGLGLFGIELHRLRSIGAGTTSTGASVLKALRSLGWYLIPPILLIGGTIGANGLIRGSYRLANGMGFASLNAVGRPQIYRHLPPDLGWITRVYEERESQMQHGYIRWGVVLDPLLEARRRHGLPAADYDRAALDTTLKAIRARPAAYLKIWKQTFLAYWGGYEVVFGPWKNQRVLWKREGLQLTRPQWQVVQALSRFWKRFLPGLSILCLLALPLVLLDRRWNQHQRLAAVWMWATTLVVSLASTAIESSVGQSRYRMPWVAPIVLLAAVALVSLPGGLRALALWLDTVLGKVGLVRSAR